MNDKRFKGIRVYGQKDNEIFIKDTVEDYYYNTQDSVVELLNSQQDKIQELEDKINKLPPNIKKLWLED